MIALSSSARAEGSIRALGLVEALAYAREHQPAIRAALARTAAARADRAATRAQWMPFAIAALELVGGSANNTTSTHFGVPGLDLPRIGATKTPADNRTLWDPHASTLAAVSVSQELFDFGRIAAQAAVDDALIHVADQQSKDTALEIDLGVEEAFFAVEAAHAVVKASEDAVQRARIHREEASAGVKGGLRAPIELTRADADLTRFDVGRIRALGGLESAQASYAAAVGVPDLTLDTAGGSPEPAALPSLQAALDAAAAKNPRLLEAAARLEAQEAFTTAVLALLLPNLALTGSFFGSEGGAPGSNGEANRFAGWLPETPNWDVGIVFRWPLYDGVVWARKDASRERELIRKAEIEVVRYEQNAAVQQAHVRTAVAQKAIGALEHAKQAAEANYAQADARFRAGLGTSVELADAETLRTDAEIQLAIGRFDLARARALLGRLIAEAL
jgi:outer membrane protein TolC